MKKSSRLDGKSDFARSFYFWAFLYTAHKVIDTKYYKKYDRGASACVVKSLMSETTPLATLSFKRSHKISHSSQL